MIDSLNKSAKKYGMKINIKKTIVMRISRSGAGDITIRIDGQAIKQAKMFQYLGT